jgi:hypothetical protein
MPRLSGAAGMIGKTSFFKDVSHFNTVAFNSPKAAMVYKSSSDIQQGSSISSLKSPFSESCQGHALLSEDTLTLTTTRQSSKRGKYLDVTPHKQKKGVWTSGHRIG